MIGNSIKIEIKSLTKRHKRPGFYHLSSSPEDEYYIFILLIIGQYLFYSLAFFPSSVFLLFHTNFPNNFQEFIQQTTQEEVDKKSSQNFMF